ncbi:MAG TPA: stage III sporulation protein AE, partial [Clostridiales bacterium]|nr:stage III sporulation protein AE [Clostridiales bacterium]
WLLGLTTTIFVGLLSVQGLVGAAADNVTTKALKFSLGAFVPVVGGALGDALNTIKGCLNLLKSTLGGFGIISTLLIVLPPIIECVVWIILLNFLNMAAEMFSLNSVSTLFKSAQGVMKTLIAVLASCSMFMIVATTIVTLAGGGTS